MDTYERVTNAIIEAIEQGTQTFVMPWHKSGGKLPFNALNANPYQGINTILLWCEARARGYVHDGWATYKQWAEKGCQVRKGEKASPIIFYKELVKENEQGEEEKRRIVKSYAVFNAAQVDGYDLPDLTGKPPVERLEAVEAAIRKTGIPVTEEGDRAFYRPSSDTVTMPDSRLFKGEGEERQEAWYSVLFHELGHATGHPSRLDRQMGQRFGDDAYAAEELVAELTAAYCMARLGLSSHPRDDHAAYIQSWLKALKNDKKLIFVAAAKAQAATDYLL